MSSPSSATSTSLMVKTTNNNSTGTASPATGRLYASKKSSDSTSSSKNRRVVIKIGTSSLLKEDQNRKATLCLSRIAGVVELVCELKSNNVDVVLVTSGAVGSGMLVLGLRERPDKISTKQALAAVGQVHLMGKFEGLFQALNQPCAQVLLTYENLGDRNQYLSARNTFDELLALGVVPIVNENDTVAIRELKFDDNDRLSAMVASLINAEWLFLLTDVAGLYTANPTLPDAKFIPHVPDIRQLMSGGVDVNNKGSNWGTGGMATKIRAAEISTASGTKTIVMSSSEMNRVKQWVLEQEKIDDHIEDERKRFGTLFHASINPIKGRKKWIKGLQAQGTLQVDEGGYNAVLHRRSLFPAGIKSVKGDFSLFDPVRIENISSGEEIAIGLVNFNSDELRKIIGKKSNEINAILNVEGAPQYAMDIANMVCSIRESPSSASTTAVE